MHVHCKLFVAIGLYPRSRLLPLRTPLLLPYTLVLSPPAGRHQLDSVDARLTAGPRDGEGGGWIRKSVNP